ncbi:MAG: type II toxin-antitoxin system Phd/YefM family antitoxin [Stackebrandtia sp.]
MSAVPARDLRNHTAEVLRRVSSGEEIEVLQNNQPVAKLIPIRGKRRWIPGREVAVALERFGPDSTGLAAELRETLSETTDDLPW